MSDSKPSGTLGGLVSGLFGGNKTDGDASTGFTSRHKLLSGVLLAAGAAYLYKRVKSKETAL